MRQIGYDWRLQDQSIAVLNMSFDTKSLCGVTDYSTFQNLGLSLVPSIYSWIKGKYVFRWFPRWLYRVKMLIFFPQVSVSTWIKNKCQQQGSIHYISKSG